MAPAYEAVVPPPRPGTIAFSDDAVDVVDGLAKWMRFVGAFYFIGGGLLGVLGLIAVTQLGGWGVPAGIAVVSFMVVLIAGGMWLRQSGDEFRQGIAGEDEATVGAGFATFGKYVRLFGILAILNVIGTIVQVVGS